MVVRKRWFAHIIVPLFLVAGSRIKRKLRMPNLEQSNHFRSLCSLLAFMTALLGLLGCDGGTHITGTVKNAYGGPMSNVQVTLKEGDRSVNAISSDQGKFTIGMTHSPFNVELELSMAQNGYKPFSTTFHSHDHLKTIDVTMQEAPEPTLAEVRIGRLKGLNAKDAKELAELMCSQLPNAAAFPMKSFLSGDDVHDTLVLLGGVAQPCLVEHLADSTWMPDSRSEPLSDFHAGDAALWILADAGRDWDIVVPLLNQKKWNGVGVFAYFEKVNQGSHRKVVQQTVRRWLQKHPDCCGTNADFTNNTDSPPAGKISPQRFAELAHAWKQLKPGMDEQVARKLLGPSDDTADPERWMGWQI